MKSDLVNYYFIFVNPGDTTLNLADIFPDGTVVAFEMGPPVDILRLNVRSRNKSKIYTRGSY